MAAKGGKSAKEPSLSVDSCGEEELCYSPSPQRSNFPDEADEHSPNQVEDPIEDAEAHITVPSPLPKEDTTAVSETAESLSTSTSQSSPLKANSDVNGAESSENEEQASSVKEVELVESESKQTKKKRVQSSSEESSRIESREPKKTSSSTSDKEPSSPEDTKPSQNSDADQADRSPSRNGVDNDEGSVTAETEQHTDDERDNEDAEERGVSVMEEGDDEYDNESDVASDDYLSEVDGVSDGDENMTDLSDSEASYIEIDGDDASHRSGSSNEEGYDRPLSLNAKEEGEASQMWKGRSGRRPSRREEEDRRRERNREVPRRSEMSSRRREMLDREREQWRRQRDARDRDARRDIERRRASRRQEEESYASLRRRRRGGRRERLRRLYKRLDRVEQQRMDAEELRELERRREIVRRRLARENARFEGERPSRSLRHSEREVRYRYGESRHEVRVHRSPPPSYRSHESPRERAPYRPRSPRRYERERPSFRRREYESPHRPEHRRWEEAHHRPREEVYRRPYREPSPRRHVVYESSSRRRSSPRRRPPSPPRHQRARSPLYVSPSVSRRHRHEPDYRESHRSYPGDRHRSSDLIRSHSSSSHSSRDRRVVRIPK